MTKCILVFVVFLCACSGAQQTKAVQAGVDAIGLAVCVLEHDEETVEQIAVDCAGATINGVKHILEAQQKSYARHGYAACPRK